MAETNPQSEPASEATQLKNTFNVTILSARNLKGTKELINSFARIEFGKKPPVDSPVVAESKNPEYNHTFTFEVAEFDNFLNTLASAPIKLQVHESLPRDKSNLVGSGEIELFPLLEGELGFQTTVTLTNVNGEESEGEPMEVLVDVKLTDAILSEQDLEISRLLTIKIDSVHSCPELWVPSDPNSTFTFSAGALIPSGAQEDSTITFPDGVYHQGEPIKEGDPIAASPSAYIEEEGDLKQSDIPFRREAETYLSKVSFGDQKRCFLGNAAMTRFQQKIAANVMFPIEVKRTQVYKNEKQAAQMKSADVIPYNHCVAFLNLKSLLYPGVTSVKGAYWCNQYNEKEVASKTSLRSASSMSNERASADGQPGSGRSSGSARRRRVSVGYTHLERAPGESTEDGSAKPEEDPTNEFKIARTYVVIEVSLNNAIVPKRPESPASKRVSEYIPPRTSFPKVGLGAKKAVEEYRQQISKSVKILFDEYVALFNIADQEVEKNEANRISRRQLMLYELNTSGKYFALKEQLKRSVIRLVREKYLKTSAFSSREELQTFLQELYVFLVEQMHYSINEVFSLEDKVPVPSIDNDLKVIKSFAHEAEILQKYDLAAKYYEDCIARDKKNAEHWFDYGCFCMRIGDTEKAEECFRDAIAINQKHVKSILVFGALKVSSEEYSTAGIFFQAAVEHEPENIIAWVMIGLFYSISEQNWDSEKALGEATRLQQSEKEGSGTPNSIYLNTIKFLLQTNLKQMAEMALTSNMLVCGPSSDHFLLLGKFFISKLDYESARTNLEKAVMLNHQDPDVRSALGHVYFFEEKYEEALPQYEQVLLQTKYPEDIDALYLRIAKIYLSQERYEDAKKIYLKAVARAPSSITWLGVGLTCYHLGEFEDSEEALAQANVLNNKDPVVWGYLTLINLKQEDRMFEAEQSYKQALKLGIKEEGPELYEEIMSITEEDSNSPLRDLILVE